MSPADRVAARFCRAGKPPSPADLAKELKELASTLIKVRVPVRDAFMHVHELGQDYGGVSGYPGPGDATVKETVAIFDQLDHHIGQAFRAAAVLAEKLEKHR